MTPSSIALTAVQYWHAETRRDGMEHGDAEVKPTTWAVDWHLFLVCLARSLKNRFASMLPRLRVHHFISSGALANCFTKLMRSGGRRILDFLFPPLCAACRAPVAEAHNLCAECWGKITFLSDPGCAVCGFPFAFDAGPETVCAACQARPPAFDRARALMRYDAASREPILALKRADRLDLVPGFARWLAHSGGDVIQESDIIVPVPLHHWRLWRRRFNQSALLARALGRLTKKPVDCLALARARATLSQGEMPSAGARFRNVQGAFRVAGNARVRGKTVLLVDDVFTTGATIEACSRALKRAGAARVVVLALARVVRSG